MGRHSRARATLALVTSHVEKELDDRWWLGLRSRRLESVQTHDFAVVLNFESGAALTVEAAASSRLTTSLGETPAVTQNEDGTIARADALLPLVGQHVLSGVAFKTGGLRIVFESGALLTVANGTQHEAWQLRSTSGRAWVSLPGARLASFQQNQP